MKYGSADVRVFPSESELGGAAAADAASVITDAVQKQGRARVIVATGNSQIALITALTEIPGVPWKSVEIFHLDEYVGMPDTHPSSFRLWIKRRIEDKVHPGTIQYMRGDTPDLEAEIKRYTKLLNEAPLDLAFVGFGENGHIAFNDPHVADFSDPAIVKQVVMDDASRKQQAGEGHFDSPGSVPHSALTVTCPALMRAGAWICSVPELRKAKAVKNALEGPIATSCPSSIVRTHPNARVYLDTESASLLRR